LGLIGLGSFFVAFVKPPTASASDIVVTASDWVLHDIPTATDEAVKRFA
jgi:hypothetical protein